MLIKLTYRKKKANCEVKIERTMMYKQLQKKKKRTIFVLDKKEKEYVLQYRK